MTQKQAIYEVLKRRKRDGLPFAYAAHLAWEATQYYYTKFIPTESARRVIQELKREGKPIYTLRNRHGLR